MVATRAGRSRERALVSDHLMKQSETIEWSLTRAFSSFVVIILNSFLLPITEEVLLGTSQRTISICVVYYSKSEQDL